MKHPVPVWISSMALITGLARATSGVAQDKLSTPDFDSSVLAEITVTATRREESLNKVPISISAYTQETMDVRGVRGIEDISRLTPGLTLQPAYSGTTAISIRGISSTVGAATTGVYIDDTPIQFRVIGDAPTNAYPTIFDLERVEVLRGPQGTLFGAGSEGGTVRFITPKPDLHAYSGYARSDLGYTQDGAPSYETGVAAGGPLIEDRLGFRVSAYYQRQGGWIDRVDPVSGAVVDSNANSDRSFVGRAAFAIAPTETLRITPAVYLVDSRENDASRFWVGLSDPRAGQFRNASPSASPITERFTLPSLAVEWELGGARLFSNTSFFNRHNDNDFDISVQGIAILTKLLTGTAVPLLPGQEHFRANAGYSNTQNVFTQELRLQSSGATRLTWTGGVFYQMARQRSGSANRGPLDDWFTTFFGAPTTTAQVLGVPLLPGNVILSHDVHSKDEQLALFGDVGYHFSSTLALTAGLRLSRTRFAFTDTGDGPFNGGPSFSSGSQQEKPLTPKLGLTYAPSDALLLYATAAKGFRPGGANPTVPLTTCAQDLQLLGLTGTPSTYQSDSVRSYELGTKLTEDRLRAQASAFYIDWNAIQQRVLLPLCTYQFTSNLGKAVSKGGELQVQADIIHGLAVELAIGYNDARYTQRVTGAGSTAPQAPVFVSKGDALPVPKWTFAVSPELTFHLQSGHRVYVRSDFTYVDGYPTFPAAPAVGFLPDGRPQRPTRLVTLRSGIKRGGWDLSLFANNLLNSVDLTDYSNDVIGSPLYRAMTFRRRTIGAEASYRF